MATDPLQNQLEQILVSIMSTDNEVRALAEKACEQIAVGPKAQYLLQTLHNNVAAEEVLQLAAVLLRRVFSLEWEDLYTNLPPEVKAQFLAQLLATGQATQQPNVSSQLRKKVGEVLAEAARNLIDDEGNNKWPEYLKFLFECASSPLPVVKESALQMFSLVPGIFGNQQANYLEVIHQMLLQALQDQANQQVRFSAVKATTSFLLAHEKDTAIHRHFSDLLPLLLQSIADSVQAQDDDTYLKCLIELAENTPRYLRFQFDPVMQLCMKVLADGNMLESWRHLALEVTVTLSETASAMMRKLGSKYLSALVVQILAMMVDLDDEPDWAISDEVAEDDNDSNSVVGESALDRLACGLGGKVILQQVTTNVPQMLNNADWKQRHAALMAVSAVGEGCHKQMEILLPQLMDGILPFLQDPHPRVRFAACNAIGQMATDFAPVFEKKFHEKVIPGLLMLLEDSAHPRVQAHAGAALVNFAEDCPKNLLVIYLERIMERLEAVLSAKFNELVEKGTKLVLEQIVTTVASVADTAEDKFTAYYDRFMPCLKYIIQNAVTPELRVLRGKTIECVSLIGLAVGAEKFLPDASAIMELLLRAQAGGEELADDDPQVSYMISAWARICKIMGKQFEQYLPLVMGPVMRAASVKPEVALVDSDDMKVIEGDDEWQFVSLGEQQNFGIRTAGLEDKATACQMLVCYARELKEGFAEYTEQVVKLMVPMLKFYFHDGVRSAASESLPCLLECAKIKGEAFIADMWNYICPELLKVMDTEPESDVLAEHLQAMAKCIEVTGRSLSEESMNELVRILNNILKEHFEKFNERQAKRTDEDYDEEVEETLLDEDDQDVEILARVSDVIHAVFTAYKETFFPRFDQLLPHFVKLLADDRPWSDHQWALCVFDDVIEHGGPACIKYQAFFLPHLIKYINSSTAEVRQAAAYGVGVMAQFAGDQFAQVCAEAIPPLVKVISEPESRGPENVSSTENAIAAVTKILKYNSSVVNVDEILPHWLSWLPVWEDDAETPHVYGYLCDLIEGNHRLVLGENDSNLPRLVAIIAEVFNKEAISKDHPVYQRLVNIIRQVQTNADVFGACLAQLSPALHQTLHNLLSAQ